MWLLTDRELFNLSRVKRIVRRGRKVYLDDYAMIFPNKRQAKDTMAILQALLQDREYHIDWRTEHVDIPTEWVDGTGRVREDVDSGQ